MKHNNKNKGMKVMACTLLLSTALAGVAFAAPNEAVPISEKPSDATDVKIESPAQNFLRTGKITSIEKRTDNEKQEYYTIETTDDYMGIIYHSKNDVFVIDQKTGKNLALADLKAGMTITAVIPKNAPMTLSLPPQTGSALGFIVNQEAGSVDLSVYDADLLNFEKDLKLNVGENTKIVDVKGTKKAFTKEDLKGSESLVLYTVTTRSIPAQTNPSLVVILNTADELKAAADKAGKIAEQKETTDVKYVSLREVADAKGYEITWKGMDQPIILSKTGETLTLNLNSKAFTYTHMTRDLKPLDMVTELDLPVIISADKTMIPQTLADMLTDK